MPTRVRTVGRSSRRLARDWPALLALEPELRALRPPVAGLVQIAVPVPDKVQACTRPELDEVERVRPGSLGDAQKERHEHPGTLDLVRLHSLRLDEVAQEPSVLLERVVPVRATPEHEKVQAAEHAQRRIPLGLGPDDLGRHRIVRVAPKQLCVERRPALALGRLVEEDLPASRLRLCQARSSPALRSCRTRPGRRQRCPRAPSGRARSPPCGSRRRTGCTRAPRSVQPR